MGMHYLQLNNIFLHIGSCAKFNYFAASEPPSPVSQSIVFVVQSTLETTLMRQKLANNLQKFIINAQQYVQTQVQYILVTFNRQSKLSLSFWPPFGA